VTLIVVLWDAVPSTLMAVLRIVASYRDRPRLVVTAMTSLGRNQPTLVGIDVANRGRQPTTITEAGFLPDAKYSIAMPGVEDEFAVEGPWTINEEDQVALVQPGGIARFRMILEGVPHFISVDQIIYFANPTAWQAKHRRCMRSAYT
jgi:hypothetical protein